MASGAAFRYLGDRLGNVNEVFGPSFAMEDGEIRRWASVTHTMTAMRRELPGSVRMWMETVDEWEPDVVVTDFEPLSGIYARWSRTPLICVDNIHMIDRCRHDKAIVDGAREDFRIARAVTRAMVPTAGDYVITTFFAPPLLRGRTVARAADRAAGDRRGAADARRPPRRLLGRERGAHRGAARDRRRLSRVRDARRPAGRHDRRRHRVLRALVDGFLEDL